ncbi:putative entry exclusion protein TrbK-alt [Bradyrhizobium sp.]|uniref:putative entry exclusion protein TrbK-alt n=1 Tax=Bradyrhizobium sp. TaxID=376 RepID=UPI001EBA7DEF|nr:putative entry exclusion protein TrbK-alt [Bradyrhizobium sp.]MBV8920954.1 putative entry exclusion protein TrbK-alt [Bradyrhizobium sp.]MBV9980669.1 putative entry exclusion protein TrbK-alt [Bradyrhizobium sp.]
MKMTKLKRIPTVAAVVLLVLVVAACSIRLRDDESQTLSATPADQVSDPLAAKLAECRSVTSEQKDALAECRKAWAEERRQFLGQKAPSASSNNGPPQEGALLFVPPKDQSRLSPGYPFQQPGKE